VTITGNPPAAAPNRPVQAVNSSNARLQIQSRENLPTLVRTPGQRSVILDADGAFNLVNLVESQYSITALTGPGLPADAYVSEILVDSKNASEDGSFTIAGHSEVNMEVTIRRCGGILQGSVEDAKHNPVAGARVLLIPDPPRRGNLLAYKGATSTATGTFNLNGVAPGTYRLYSWEQNTSGAEQNADFMKEYDLLGTSISVTAGATQSNIQVRQIPAKH
jgi:hypothetical protein